MPVVAAVVVPHPPAIIPQLTQRAATELRALRSASDAAVAALVTAVADVRYVVGPAGSTVRFDASAGGTFEPWGFALRVGAAHPRGAPLPLSLAVGAWLLDRVSGVTASAYQAIAADADVEECVAVGTAIAGEAERVALLVMGDGSARRGDDSPGTPDPRAEAFDAEVAAALADGDVGGLLSLDPLLADELLAAGRPAWQVLAAAVGRAHVSATLRYASAPYGVGYFVASWSCGPHWDNGAREVPVISLPGPVIAVVGPTAAGKSALSLDLAHALGGEVVNADSMQLYRGMDIGTAKLLPDERGGVPHHVLDIWDVTQSASVAVYQRLARAAIDDILARGLVPLLVGGSGLYLRAVLEEFEFPGTDERLRADLEAQLAALGPAPLHARLAAADPAAAERILPSNGRRIVRALEVISLTGETFMARLPEPTPAYAGISIGVDLDTGLLDARIAERVRRMWAAGFVEEVRDLETAGLRSGRTAARALGYQQVLTMLAGACSETEAQERTVQATRRFVRKQRSWFRRDPQVTWVDGGTEDLVTQTLKAVRSVTGLVR